MATPDYEARRSFGSRVSSSSPVQTVKKPAAAPGWILP